MVEAAWVVNHGITQGKRWSKLAAVTLRSHPWHTQTTGRGCTHLRFTWSRLDPSSPQRSSSSLQPLLFQTFPVTTKVLPETGI